MRIAKIFASLFIVFMAVSLFGATILKDWFDYKNCDFCKQWGNDPGLIAHTHDECRNLTDGILWITHIDKGYHDRFANVVAAEVKVGEELTAGKPLKLCQYCNRIAEFTANGVRIESVEGIDVFITLYTSTDTMQVSKLHEFATQAIAEEIKANAAFLASEHELKNKK
jgi:hypothetical protein